MKNKQYFQKLLRLNRLVNPKFLTENQIKILEDQGLTEEYSELFSIPEKWMIRNSSLVGTIYDNLCDSKCYKSSTFKYLRSHNAYSEYIFGSKVSSLSFGIKENGTKYPEITLEQFKRLYDEIRS